MELAADFLRKALARLNLNDEINKLLALQRLSHSAARSSQKTVTVMPAANTDG
jgi:hypothetical protein